MANTLFLLEGKEAVARILVDFAIAWEVTWSALAALLALSEEVDGLRFAATKRNFGFVKIVLYAFAVSMFISH
jgi:hypothetical protein